MNTKREFDRRHELMLNLASEIEWLYPLMVSVTDVVKARGRVPFGVGSAADLLYALVEWYDVVMTTGDSRRPFVQRKAKTYDTFERVEPARRTPHCTWSQRGEAYRSACGYYHTLDSYHRDGGVCSSCGRKIRLINPPDRPQKYS